MDLDIIKNGRPLGLPYHRPMKGEGKMDKYRIQDKANVNYHGKKTTFKIFEYSSTHKGYLYRGAYFAKGYNATDRQCMVAFQNEIDSESDNTNF
jgi:hypothetical protein